MSGTLVVNEIYLSLQGESSFAGLPCVFVRLTACNLRCSYCDTAYAFTEGRKRTLEEILAEIRRLSAPFKPVDGHLSPQECQAGAAGDGSRARSPHQHQAGVARDGSAHQRLPLVELTGGEPLVQADSLPLMKALCDEGFTVLIETSGAHDISKIDARVRRIMDLKCPSSGEVDRNLWMNLAHLKMTDEIKFVVGTVEDYEWCARQIAEHHLARICPLLMSWVQPLSPEQQDKSLKKVPAGQTAISRRELAERIIADALPVRFQAQLHKLIWPAEKRGV